MKDSKLLKKKKKEIKYKKLKKIKEKQILSNEFILYRKPTYLVVNLIFVIFLVLGGLVLALIVKSNADYKYYNEHCSRPDECLPSHNLICSNRDFSPSGSLCKCKENYYFNKENQTCLEKKLNLIECQSNDECCCGMICGLDGKCECINTKWFDPDSRYCQPKFYFNSYCTNTDQCMPNTSMICNQTTNRCSCSYLAYWNGTNCETKRTYMNECSKLDSCNFQFQNLKCIKYADRNENTNKCLCDDETEYWNGTRCELKRDYGQSCNQSLFNSLDCLTSQNSMYCLSTSICGCQSNYYWLSSSKKCCKYLF